MSPNSNSTLPH